MFLGEPSGSSAGLAVCGAERPSTPTAVEGEEWAIAFRYPAIFELPVTPFSMDQDLTSHAQQSLELKTHLHRRVSTPGGVLCKNSDITCIYYVLPP